MKKKISKILSILLVILIILLIILIIANSFTKNKYKDDKSVHDLSNVMSFTNSLTDVYEGDLPTYKISSKIQILFETYLPMISNDVIGKSNSELSTYFEKDSERIYLNTGIKNKQEFVEFARSFKDVDNLENFKELTYLEDSYKNIKEGEESILIKVKYEKDIELQYKVYIYKEKNNDIAIKLEYVN